MSRSKRRKREREELEKAIERLNEEAELLAPLNEALILHANPFLDAVLSAVRFDGGVIELHLTEDFPLPEWKHRLDYFRVIFRELEEVLFRKGFGKYNEYVFMWGNDTMARWDCEAMRFDPESSRLRREDWEESFEAQCRELWRPLRGDDDED